MSEEGVSGTRSTRKRDRIKEFIWPVYRNESKKIVSSSFILFFVLASYSILRNMKDSLVQSSELNTEAIPYLKNFAVLPFAILITASFVKLSNIIAREKLFYYIVVTFLSVYLLFAFYWYPNIEEFKLDAGFISKLKARWPFLQHLFLIIQYWMITIFYVFAELWVSVVANLLFWQFINDITTYSESRRLYAIYSLIGHLGPSFSSAIIIFISWIYRSNGYDTAYCPGYFMVLISIVVIFAAIAMLIFRWMHVNILSPRQASKYGTPIKLEKQKTKLPFKKSIKYILNSKYILFLFLIIFAFGIQNNLMGLLWKKMLNYIIMDRKY